MSATRYRICLLVIILLALIVGIFYYANYIHEEAVITEGTLVQQVMQDSKG